MNLEVRIGVFRTFHLIDLRRRRVRQHSELMSRSSRSLEDRSPQNSLDQNEVVGTGGPSAFEKVSDVWNIPTSYKDFDSSLC
jgi:hypothetical protein